MTAKILHLHPAASRAPAIETVTAPAHRQAEITEARDAAHTALTAPDVEQDLLDAVAATVEEIGKPGAKQTALLIDLARHMYTHGHMDGAANRKAARRRRRIEQGALAEVIKIETRERAELPAKERALRAVRP